MGNARLVGALSRVSARRDGPLDRPALELLVLNIQAAIDHVDPYVLPGGTGVVAVIEPGTALVKPVQIPRDTTECRPSRGRLRPR
ncbi:hypothetical protein GCM10010104_24620 [Streptomyces indiaensis]|uniref:Uncharacterized protein n=1 Tax=Streptomyces indiaensis TaxID=284033 RepID=A0ABN3DGA0_9ACTN